jgi:CRP/FNR family transcriptional regulator, cyclic AMP receptor protein
MFKIQQVCRIFLPLDEASPPPRRQLKMHAKHPPFDVMRFFSQYRRDWSPSTYPKNRVVYAQGDLADSVFYIHKGKVKVTVISTRGKEAVVAIRGPDEFCGEGALSGNPEHPSTVTTLATCEIVRLQKKTLANCLHNEPEFANYFLTHLLTRTVRAEEDLLDQLFNSSEMRLARALLTLAGYGNGAGAETPPLTVNQGILAELIGTTRSRVNFFMNKFRNLGLIEYNGHLKVRKALLNYVLNDKPRIKS